MIFGQLFVGLTGVIFGTGRFLEPAAIVPQLDNQFRYLSGIYLLVSFLIWWMVPTIERHGTLIRIVTLALFLGGVALFLGRPSASRLPSRSPR